MSIADTPADVQHILADLHLALPRRHWLLFDWVTLEADTDEVRLVCSLADRGLIEAHLLPVLRAQGEPCGVRVVTQGVASQAGCHAPKTKPPDWAPYSEWPHRS